MQDFNGDGRADLATSAYYENTGRGAVWTAESSAGRFDLAATIAFGPGAGTDKPRYGRQLSQ